MRILWVNNYPDFVGGAERYIHDLASSLNEHQHFLLYTYKQLPNTHYSSAFTGSFPLVSLRDQINEINPDIIYVHNISDEKIYEDIIKNFCEKKVFRFIHDHKLLCPREHKYTLLKNKTCTKPYGLNCIACCGCINFKDKKIVTPRYLDNVHSTIKKSDKIVVGSQYMKRQLLDQGYDESLISCIPLYSRFMKTSSKALKSSNITYVGSIKKGKGFDFLLNSLMDYRDDLNLHVLTNESALPDEEFLNPNVHIKYYKNQTHNELQAHIKTSQLVVIPSISPEGFSFVGVEALALGTKVLTSDVGGTSEWSDFSGVMKFNSGDKKDFLQKLNLILESEVAVDNSQVLSLDNYIKIFNSNVLENANVMQ